LGADGGLAEVEGDKGVGGVDVVGLKAEVAEPGDGDDAGWVRGGPSGASGADVGDKGRFEVADDKVPGAELSQEGGAGGQAGGHELLEVVLRPPFDRLGMNGMDVRLRLGGSVGCGGQWLGRCGRGWRSIDGLRMVGLRIGGCWRRLVAFGR
jgi:hypothetical protein